MKGPYLQVGLPFRIGGAGRKFFGHFETQYPGYVHQEAAWLRLASNQQAANTLVATGTGSGKTECFLYPLLDHASRAKAAGEQGIKALVIYPMNALASDQARRIAELVDKVPAFKGLRVGLFVGGQAGLPGSGTMMTAGSVITDRETLRRAPPDILLTNYKMLDYLLIRPRDRKLWEKNTPTTLRYVVVDELHTFDGAQGTDLALLLRRLRARLQTPEGHLVYAGTSATLGGSTDTQPLRDYAEQIFGSAFPPDSVVTENRKSVAEFLGDATIEHVLQWQEGTEALLLPAAYATQQAAVRAWFAVFFPDKTVPADVEDGTWRMALGEMLKKHLLFVNLLKLAKDGAVKLADLQAQLQGPLPEAARRHIGLVLDALLVLVAWARSPETASLPLVTLRIQLWMRELRRMVAKLAADPQQVVLKASADLKSKPVGVHIPLVQCTQCHTTAWVSRLPKGRSKLTDKLDEIYNAWFGGSADVVRVYPGKLQSSQSPVEGVPQLLCCGCGHMQGNGEICNACGNEELVPVFRTTGVRNSQRGNMAYNWHDSTCPACGARDRLILLGARNATLGSQVIEHSWASPFNDDKKLIAFSDSVQDAAHRAGFFTARTYSNTLRTAMAKAIDATAKPSIAWPEFLARFGEIWLEPGSPLAMLSREDLLERAEREALEVRFKAKNPQKWDENLLSATPTLEMGVDIGSLSAVMLCSVPPNQASFLQRIGRAGRRDGNALATTLADGSSPHDLYFFEETEEMLAGEVAPPGIFLQAADVLRRQLMAFCLDDWVASGIDDDALPEKTSEALDVIDKNASGRFPYTFLEHVLTNEPRLLAAFIQLLGKQATTRIQDRLKAFYTGTEELDGLRLSILKLLEGLAFEREQHRKRANACKDKIKALKAKPQDEATKAEIDQFDRERQGALMLVKEINQRELLNTLTDAGLIPNYAFPEAGVELKSVLWRKKGSDDVGEGAYVALPAIKYERPASSAISEFAPENRFYANQRRVEVDQINMSLAKLEDWRLCPACHHMELLGPQGEEHQHADTYANCPRCGDAMWSNISQRRPLLRFKQAIANSDDTRVRIDDSAEDREPKFYTRQLLVDVDPADVRHAWRIRTDSLPFGFEFITRANFRDINFGELGKAGENFKVADKESQRPGFKLCRHCGKVQLPPRRSDREEKKQDHAFDCEKRGAEDASSIIECLYLYREFSSEALRILVPYTQSGIDDEVVQSFIAALQLGLKKRFGGRVDHLRITTQDEPGREGGPRRQYVLLYDSVPGGTGYLEQLLSEDAQTLTDVLKMARDALHACSCNQNPEKDGCYRCLYQYRLGRSMALVSRRRAAEVLDELLGKLDQLEQVKNISEIYINPNFDSALEARFIESLKRLGGKAGIPHSKLVGEIIKGKSGYLLEIGGQRYWVEPQGKEVMSNDIVWWSNPDFVIWPAQSKSPRRPIAVFCDGWAYHHSILREDARKRSALLASGKFWVWSVTHEDVKQALLGDCSTDLESPLLRLARNDGAAKTPDFLKPDAGAFQSNAVAQLLSWLAMPVELDFDPGESKLRRNAVALTFRMLSLPNDPEHEVLKTELAALQMHWPAWIEVPSNAAAAGSKEGAAPVVRMWWPQAFGKSGATADLSPGMVLLNDDAELPEKERQLVWRQWLQLFNHLQVLSGMFLATRRGIQGDDYLPLPAPTGFGSPSDSPSGAQEQAWAAALDSAMSITHGGLAVLQSAGAMPPDEIGFELQDEAGEVCAEAELAWSSCSVLLLLEHQAEHLTQWQSAGWTVIQYHDGWAEQVLAQLNAAKDTQ